MDLLLSIWDMYAPTSTEVKGERNIESGKLSFRKEVGQQFPHGNIFVSVFNHINKKIVKNVSNSTGIINSFISTS